MPINGYNTGRDVALDINMPNGPVRLANITDFTSKEMTKSEESHGIDGVSRYQEIPKGWEGTIDIDRANSNADTAIAYLEGLYFAGLNVPASTIVETIQEPTGGITQWRYWGVQFKMDDHGSWKGDGKVTQKLGWKSSGRIQQQ